MNRVVSIALLALVLLQATTAMAQKGEWRAGISIGAPRTMFIVEYNVDEQWAIDVGIIAAPEALLCADLGLRYASHPSETRMVSRLSVGVINFGRRCPDGSDQMYAGAGLRYWSLSAGPGWNSVSRPTWLLAGIARYLPFRQACANEPEAEAEASEARWFPTLEFVLPTLFDN